MTIDEILSAIHLEAEKPSKGYYAKDTLTLMEELAIVCYRQGVIDGGNPLPPPPRRVSLERI